MPLPSDWKGAFWGHGLMDDILFDASAEEFIAWMVGFEGEYFLPYFVTGAWFDLKRYGDEERADAIMNAAEEKLPFLWEDARSYADDALTNMVDAQADPATYCGHLSSFLDMLWQKQGNLDPHAGPKPPPIVI